MKNGAKSVAKRVLLAVALLACGAAGCVHGRSVEAGTLPSKMYPGRLPDTALATFGVGVTDLRAVPEGAAVLNGELWSVFLESVDGEKCKECRMVQVLPGRHKVGVRLRSLPSSGDRQIAWKETKEPLVVELTLERGVAYALLPGITRDGLPSAWFKKLCFSTAHVATVKAFQERGAIDCR